MEMWRCLCVAVKPQDVHKLLEALFFSPNTHKVLMSGVFCTQAKLINFTCWDIIMSS